MRTSERAFRTIRARKKEIARRHRKSRKPNLGAIRIREIVSLLQHRYGGDQLPPGADADVANYVLACHLALLPGDPHRRLNSHLDMRAAWMTRAERDALIVRALGNPYRWTAARLGQKLGLKDAERDRLKITTIRSTDGLPSKERKRNRDRERRRRERESAGCMKRTDYLEQSKERLEPWNKLSISRATWYRLPVRERAELAARAGSAVRVLAAVEMSPPCNDNVRHVGRQLNNTFKVATDLSQREVCWVAARDDFPLAAKDDDGGRR